MKIFDLFIIWSTWKKKTRWTSSTVVESKPIFWRRSSHLGVSFNFSLFSPMAVSPHEVTMVTNGRVVLVLLFISPLSILSYCFSYPAPTVWSFSWDDWPTDWPIDNSNNKKKSTVEKSQVADVELEVGLDDHITSNLMGVKREGGRIVTRSQPPLVSQFGLGPTPILRLALVTCILWAIKTNFYCNIQEEEAQVKKKPPATLTSSFFFFCVCVCINTPFIFLCGEYPREAETFSIIVTKHTNARHTHNSPNEWPN